MGKPITRNIGRNTGRMRYNISQYFHCNCFYSNNFYLIAMLSVLFIHPYVYYLLTYNSTALLMANVYLYRTYASIDVHLSKSAL